MPHDVLAVVVSFNGGGQTARTVDALRPQVGHVLVVDNASNAESRAILDVLEGDPRVTVDRLEANWGIGHALNRGIRRARELGYSWLLTMDQDSVVDAGMIAAFQDAIARDASVVCLAPSMEKNGVAGEAPGRIAYAITSGNLVRLDVFDQAGEYDEGFFIDCIDFDFSLRVRRAGHSIWRVQDALMTHQLGEPGDPPVGIKRYYAKHSPARRYYMYRNFGFMLRRYLLAFPMFMLKLSLSQILLTVLIAFFDTHPIASYRAVVRGLRDCALGRSGPEQIRAV